MSYAQQYTLMVNPLFRGRVMMAMIAAATNVLNEAPDVPDTARRKTLARVIIENPDLHINRFLTIVAANPVISTDGPDASADTDIDFVIGSVFTIIAIQVT